MPSWWNGSKPGFWRAPTSPAGTSTRCGTLPQWQGALAQLEAEGLVRTERTSGRFVTEDIDLIEQLRASAARNIAADFLEQMRSIGYTPQQAAELLRSWNETEGKQHE